MQLRVADQVESERRAALAAGRRRIEREMSTRLAEQQSASMEQQQASASCWATVGMPLCRPPLFCCTAVGAMHSVFDSSLSVAVTGTALS